MARQLQYKALPHWLLKGGDKFKLLSQLFDWASIKLGTIGAGWEETVEDVFFLMPYGSLCFD